MRMGNGARIKKRLPGTGSRAGGLPAAFDDVGSGYWIIALSQLPCGGTTSAQRCRSNERLLPRHDTCHMDRGPGTRWSRRSGPQSESGTPRGLDKANNGLSACLGSELGNRGPGRAIGRVPTNMIQRNQ